MKITPDTAKVVPKDVPTILSTFLPYQRSFFSATAKRKLWVSSRQVGKSHAIAGILVYKALLHGAKGLSLCISVNSRSASEIILKCKMFAEAVKALSHGQIGYEASADTIRFSNGARVVSLPSTADSLRGFTSQCVCIDEAAFVWRLDEILQAIAPTLTRDPDAELIFTSTPAGQCGQFYETYLKAKDDPRWFVQKTTIHDAIRCGLKVDLDSLHSLCPDPATFAQEYECEFKGSSSQFVDLGLLAPFSQGYGASGKQTFVGVDFARSGDSTAIVTVERLQDDRHTLVVKDAQVLRNLPYASQIAEIKKRFTAANPALLYGDATGMGGPLCEQLHSFNARMKPFTFTSASKPKAFEYLKGQILDSNLFFEQNLLQDFKDDFALVEQKTDESGRTTYLQRRASGSHADLVSALVLALQAAHDLGSNLSAPIPYVRRSRLGAGLRRI